MLGALHIALTFALAREAAIDLRGVAADARCPSVAVLGDALEARLPGGTVRADAPDRELLRLDVSETDAAVRFALVDEAGHALLERTLALPVAAGCAVRAETIALVVERYLRQLRYREKSGFPALESPAARAEAPPPAAPRRPPLALAAGVGFRPSTRWPTRTEPELVAELLAARVALTLSAAVTLPFDVPIAAATGPPGALRYQALPLRLGVGLPLFLPHGAGWVAPTLLAGIDLFSAESRGIAAPVVDRNVEPAADAGLVAMIHLGDRLALRPTALLGLQRERTFRLRDAAPGEPPIFVDPRFSLRFGLDLAFWLGKK